MTVTHTTTAMAMDFTLTVVGDVSPDAIDLVAPHLAADLAWVDEVFSTYRADSWVSRLSSGTATVADAPPAVAEVLDLCERFRDETGGWFDARTPTGGLDPTGIVKTWAMERSRWRLGLLGGSGWSYACAGDITVAGAAPTDAGWRIGIADPRDPPGPRARSVSAVTLGGGKRAATCLATSGRSGAPGHIWAPRRSRGPEVAQASVRGSDLVQCDAWATAIVAGGLEVAQRAPEFGMEVMALRIVGERVKSFSTPRWSV
ncbi:FAD:protein FMN transferase [Demequina globuliformis]|uniref:FAD:protein FMN transferase n=1 Tax=Demequina globuliformis TaxID=676202 RepID=UPI0007844726|nr:FAD:protein FMN transferase [Demequina globuliformis]